MRFQVVCLSIPSVPTLCLKNPEIANDKIHLELFLTVGVVRWSNLPGYWQLKDKMNSLSTISNHLLEQIGVTVIYPKYSYKLLFNIDILTWSFGWAVWHSCWMGYQTMADLRTKGPQLRLGYLGVGKMQSLSSIYCTRPCCLVSAITRHTCPDPNLDSWNCLPH